MKFLLAPNAMKGALSAEKIAAILSKTIRRKYPDAEVISLPIADGGNGTLDCLMNALGGTISTVEVTGPLPSMRVQSRIGYTAGNIAVIESAEAVGLHLLSPSPETIAQSTSRGIGELILDAMKHQCTEVWIGVGGSAVNDGGAGMARALGYECTDENGEQLTEGAIHLIRLGAISGPALPRSFPPVKILADVRNILLGENGATMVFAPQKGASPEQLPYLESALKNFSDIVRRDLKKECSEIPGSGAAGGVAYGLLTFCNASIVSGAGHILDAAGFDDAARSCDCVITTEGMLDAQTLYGKGIAELSQRLQKTGTPLHVFAGRVAGSHDELQSSLRLASLTQVSPEELATEQAMRDASWLLADAVYRHPF